MAPEELPIAAELYRQASVAVEEGRDHDAGRLYAQALAAAEADGDELLALRALFALGHQHERFARIEEARACHREVIDRARQLGRREYECGAHQQLGVVAIKADDLDEADRQLDQALAIAEALDDVQPRDHMQQQRAYIQQERGFLALCRHQPDQALELFADAAACGRQVGIVNIVGNALYGIGAARCDVGDVRGGAADLEQALSIKLDLEDSGGVHVIAVRAGAAAVAAGDERGHQLLGWARRSCETAGAMTRYERHLLASAPNDGTMPSQPEDIVATLRAVLADLSR